MKKKLLVLFLAIVSCFSLAFGLSACKTPVEQSQGGTTNPPVGEEKGKVCFVVDGEVYEEVVTKGNGIVSLPKAPTKNNYVFEGWYWDDRTFQQPFAANSLLETELNATINVYAKWAVDLPYLFESQTYVYDGTEKSLQVYNLSSGITVTYSQNNKLTEVGSVQVTATFYDGGVALGSKTATLTITPATPNITVYNQQKLTVDSEVELKVTGNVEGKATLNVGQQLRVGRADYSWTFVPNDNKNYKTVMGTVQLDVDATVTFKNEDKLFGTQTVVQNGVTHSPSSLPEKEDEGGYRFTFSHWSTKKDGEAFSFDTPIEDNITLYAVYESEPICYSVTYLNTKQAENNNVVTYLVTDDTIALSPISVEHYVFEGWYNERNQKVTEILHGSYGNVTLTAKWTAKTYKISYRLEGGSLTGETELDYTVENAPMDLIAVPTKENYRFAGWYENQDGEGTNVTSIDLASVRDYVLYAKWTPYVDINSVGFTDKTYEYDGSRKSLTAANIPEGVSVEYTKNYLIDVGSLSVTATFYIDGEIAGEKTATLRIIKATHDMSEIVFANKTFDYDGTAKSITVSGDLPDGVSVSYENNGKIQAGRYTVTAKFEYDTFNYNEIEDLTATLTINKVHCNLSNITFTGARYTYDGQPKFVTVEGVLPSDVTVSYTGNGKVNAGTYTVVAKFECGNPNYYAIDDWAVSLIIEKADYNMNFVSFKNRTFTYDGSPKSLSVGGDIPIGVTVTYMNNAKIDAGTYTVTAKFAGDTANYNLISDMVATLTVAKATPDVNAVCTQTLNLRSTVELTAQTEVEGTIVFDDGQSLVLGRNRYHWTFTPANENNYEVVTGTVELNVCALVVYYNDGEEVAQQNISVNNSAFVPEATPSRNDSNGLRFTFSHWSLQQNGGAFDFTSVIEKDTDLYAVYTSEEIEYSIFYFDAEGAQNDNATKYTVSSQFSLAAIARDYYEFGGWYNEEGTLQTQVTAGTTGNLSFFAKWTPVEYQIEYASKYKAKNSNPQTYNIESEFLLEAPVFDEYHVFEGWFADQTYSEEVNAISAGGHVDIVLYAKWSFTGTYITTATELKNAAYNMRGVYELANSITVTESDGWVKIGDEANPFNGYFNGANFTVIGVDLLFGTIGGLVQNVSVLNGKFADTVLENGTLYNGHSTDALLTKNSGIVDLCSASNGLVVENTATGVIRNSYSDGGYVSCKLTNEVSFLKGKVGPAVYHGGLVAYNEGLIENSAYTGQIKIENTFYPTTTNKYNGNTYCVGGLVGGGNNGSVVNCYSNASINITECNKVEDDGEYRRECYCDVSIGGLVGHQKTVQNSYAVGDVYYKTKENPWSGVLDPAESIQTRHGYLEISTAALGHIDEQLNTFEAITKDENCMKYENRSWKGGGSGSYIYYSVSVKTSSGNDCYSSTTTNVTNFKSRDFVVEKLTWGEFVDEEHVSEGNVWVLVNGEFPKLWFEI